MSKHSEDEMERIKAENEQLKETNRKLHRRAQRAEADAERRVKKKLDWDRISEWWWCRKWVIEELEKDPSRVHLSEFGKTVLALEKERADIAEAEVERLKKQLAEIRETAEHNSYPVLFKVIEEEAENESSNSWRV